MQALRGAPELATDTQLLDRYAAGDDDALQSLVARHWASCYRVALSVTRDTAGAEDAAQEAVIALLEEVRQERFPNKLGAWLRGVALNKARMQARAGTRRSRREEAVGRERGLLESGEAGDPMARLEELTGHLEEDLRVPLELHFGLGYSHREVAELVGCPVGTASSRIRRGLASVKERLGESGQTLAPAALASLLLAATQQASAATPPLPPLDHLRRERPPLLPPLSAARLLALAALALVGAGVTLKLVIPSLSPGAGVAAVGSAGGGAPQNPPAPAPSPLGATGSGTGAAGGGTAGETPDVDAAQPTPSAAGGDPDAGPGSGSGPARPARTKTSAAAPLAPLRLPKGQLWEPGLARLFLAPDGATAVAGMRYGGEQLVVWDLVQRRELTRRPFAEILPAEPSEAEQLSRTQARVIGLVDARTLLVGWNQRFALVSIPAGRLLRTFELPEGITFGSWRLLPGAGVKVLDVEGGQLVDLEAGRLVAGPKIVPERPETIALAKGLVAQLVCDEETREIRVWRAGSWEQERFELPRVEGRGPQSVAFGVGEETLLVSAQGRVARVSLADGSVLAEVRGQAGQLAEGLGLLVSSGYGRVVQRDPETLEVERVLGEAFADDPPPPAEELPFELTEMRDTEDLHLSILADGTVAAADPNGDTVRFLSASGESSVADYARPPQALAFAGGRLVAAHRRGGLSVWDPKAGKLLLKNAELATTPAAEEELVDYTDVMDEPPTPRSLALATRGELAYLVTRGSQGTTELHRIEVASGRLRDSRRLSEENLYFAALDARATRVAISSYTAKTRVLSVETLTPVGPVLPYAISLTLDSAEEGEAVALCEYDEEKGCRFGVYSLPRGEPLLRQRTPRGKGAWRLKLDLARGRLYAQLYPYVLCYDLASGKRRWARKGLSGPFCLVRQGRYLITSQHNDQGSGTRTGPFVEWGQIQVLDAETGKAVAWLRSEAQSMDLYSFAVSPDGKTLVAGSLASAIFQEGALLVYDLESVLPTPR